MSTPQKRYDDNFKYIDSFGNELPWGGFLEVGCFHRGWAEIVTQNPKSKLFGEC